MRSQYELWQEWDTDADNQIGPYLREIGIGYRVRGRIDHIKSNNNNWFMVYDTTLTEEDAVAITLKYPNLVLKKMKENLSEVAE